MEVIVTRWYGSWSYIWCCCSLSKVVVQLQPSIALQYYYLFQQQTLHWQKVITPPNMKITRQKSIIPGGGNKKYTSENGCTYLLTV